MAAFHADIYLPAALRLPSEPIDLVYSDHALNAAYWDRYGDLTKVLPFRINPNAAGVVEVETDRRLTPTKVVYRLELDWEFDLVLVVEVPRGFVRTVWANRYDDNHSTLDASRYHPAPSAFAGECT